VLRANHLFHAGQEGTAIEWGALKEEQTAGFLGRISIRLEKSGYDAFTCSFARFPVAAARGVVSAFPRS
jgi:hypothetical protein